MIVNLKHYLKFNLINAWLLCYVNFPYFISIYPTLCIKVFFKIGLFLYILYFFLLSTLSISKFLYLSIFPLLILISSIIGYYKHHYNLILDVNIVNALVNTNKEEVLGFVNPTIILWVIVIGIIPLYIFYKFYKKLTWCFFNWIIAEIICILIFAVGFLFVTFYSNIPYSSKYFLKSSCFFSPINFTSAVVDFVRLKTLQSMQKKEDITKNIEFVKTIPLTDLKLILVIGESARSKNFSLNNYERKTNPLLEKETNLISFSNVYSLDTNTINGIKNIFKLKPDANQNSLISVFNQIGFRTHWYSNQKFNSNISAISYEANIVSFSQATKQIKVGNNYDEYLLQYVKQVLKQDLEKNNFIVLHTIGSHRLYDLRYPKKFKQFQPICMNNSKIYYSVNECTNLEKLTNSYDNSILYTDYVLSNLIEILKPYNAILLYISDHGESLGENGFFYHSTPINYAPKEQLHIPMIVWFSDKYIENYKTNYDIALHNKHKELTQKVVFHSILDCIGIQSSIIDKNLSICKY